MEGNTEEKLRKRIEELRTALEQQEKLMSDFELWLDGQKLQISKGTIIKTLGIFRMANGINK